MKITDIFVHRPVLATVVSLIIVIAGLQAAGSLNVRQFPRSDNAAVTVTTAYVGADAELVRGFITTPIERAIAAADGIDYIESKSGQGVSTITARLRINYDPVKALAEISAKVDQVRGDLPPESEVPVINVVSADSQFASAYLSFRSDILEQNQITDYLIRVVQPRLAALPGVQRAEIFGERTFAMRIWLDPKKMAALYVTPTDVQQALVNNNVLSAVGQTKGSLVKVNISTDTNLQSVAEFERLVVRESDGATIRLEDVARVSLGAENYDTDTRFNGDTAVFMGIFPLPNANAIEVIERVRQEMVEIKKGLPTGLIGELNYDTTEYINNAIKEVVITLTETLCIVILVIFLFLGSVRSAIIPVVAIPVSLIGAVFLIQLFGFSLNLLTLLAIVLAVGLVVDDAIVVVENVERHLSEGQSPFMAAIYGARELVGPIISMTVTLAAVYLPIAFQGGLTGSLFREFALTLAGAVIISGVVALTLSPMMANRLLKTGMDRQGFTGYVHHLFERLKHGYRKALTSAMEHRKPLYVAWIVFSLLTVPMFMFSSKELAPQEDQSIIFGILDSPANATLEQTAYFAEQANQVFMDVPETDFTFQITHAAGGFAAMAAVPWEQRDRTVFELLPDLNSELGAIPGIQMFPVAPPSLPGGGDFPVEFVIAATADTPEILAFAKQLQEAAAQSGMFAFPPQLDVKYDQPKATIHIDPDKVADMGLTMAQVSRDLGIMMGGGHVNRFDLSGRSYKVIPQVARSERLNPEQLHGIYITGPEGKMIPLTSIATISQSVEPRSLHRMQQMNSVKISGVAIRPLDDTLAFLEKEATKILPQGYTVDYTGESRQLRVEGNKFLPAFSLAMALIFLVLAAQFNSFRDPFVILAGSVPLAMFGALIFTFLNMPAPGVPFWTNGWTTTLNIYSQVGLVTLVGLVAKNGILIVEFANHLQEKGQSAKEAVIEASITRLRPILMTTVATMAGHFPLVLVTGAGAAARNSIGLVLVGGMGIGTLFTLFVVPALYLLFSSKVKRTAPSTEAVPAEPARQAV